MFKIVEEKKIGGSSKIFLKKIAIEKKKLPKLRQNHDLQSNTSRWTDRQKCWNSGYYWSLMVDKCGNSHFIWFFIDLDKKSGSNSSKHRGGGIRPPRTIRRPKSPDFLGLRDAITGRQLQSRTLLKTSHNAPSWDLEWIRLYIIIDKPSHPNLYPIQIFPAKTVDV